MLFGAVTSPAWSISASLVDHKIGDIEYNWIGPTLPTGDDTTPRSQPPVDHITQGVQDMNIGNTGYGRQPQYASCPAQQVEQQTSGVVHPNQQDVSANDNSGGDKILSTWSLGSQLTGLTGSFPIIPDLYASWRGCDRLSSWER